MRSLRRFILLAGALLALTPALAHAAGTEALQPAPSNLQTVPDPAQATGVRVALPKPDCSARPSDCADVDVLDRLDGFNVQPRLTVPFSGPIDLATVSSSTVRLYDTSCLACAPVGIDQAVWEPLTTTLHAESADLLKEATTYLLVVTTGVRDASGQPLDRTDFLHDLNFGQTSSEHAKAYRTALRGALRATGAFTTAAAASLFTTQSITADMRKIQAQVAASAPAPAEIEASFARSQVGAIQWRRQVGTAAFSTSFVPVPALDVFPGKVGRLVFGAYDSPDYETAAKEIPAVPTTTAPAPQGSNRIQFELFLPSGAQPAGGWPVAIFGHGFTDSKQGAPWTVASSLAKAGIATIAINVVGHGGGSAGTLTILSPAFAPLAVVPDGGRGIDQDGNGTIDSTEGVNAAAPDTLVGNRDGLRQTVVDLMQLVREIQVGLDVDGDSAADLDASRIFYAGQSFGGIYGVPFLALEPSLVAGVANVPGGPIIEIARLSPSFRPLVGFSLVTRTPSLWNGPLPPDLVSFDENMPLRGLPLVVDTVPGAEAIADLLDRTEWAQQSANPAALAPHVQHPIIVQFAKGDKTVPNPTTTAILRAGGLAGRATYFRNDIAGPGGTQLYPNPHAFLTGIGLAATAPAALMAQAQIATFFATNGAVTIDPDGPGPVFEVPISGAPPEGLNF